MKKMLLRLAVMMLALIVTAAQTALAEPSAHLKAVYDALTAEGSSFSQARALYAEYYEGVSLDAALEEGGIIVTLKSDNENVEPGAWTFTEDGDYLTAVLQAQDYTGAGMVQTLMVTAASAQGVNTTLYNGYVSALFLSRQENKYVITQDDEAAGTTTYRINIAGPYDLEGLDDMALDEDILKAVGYEPLGEEKRNIIVNFGKVSMIAIATAENARFLVMEYGGLDDMALRAVTSAVKTLQPNGWEDFIAAYTELKDAQAANFTAHLNVDEAAVKEFIDNPAEGYSCAVFTVGQPDGE